jgi:hypothetical protein
MRGTTDASHRGRIRCTNRITNQVTRIIEPIPRLRPSRPGARRFAVSMFASTLSPNEPSCRAAHPTATTTKTTAAKMKKAAMQITAPSTGRHQAYVQVRSIRW